MKAKILASAVSLIVVIGVVIGVVVVINNQKNNKGGELISTQNKVDVMTLCQNSDDQKLCNDVLGPVNTTDPKGYISAVVKTTMGSVIKAFNMTDTLAVENGNSSPVIQMALEDCKDLLQSAIEELQACDALVSGSTTDQDVTDHVADIKNLLGAVIGYQQSCLDGFDTDGGKVVQSQLQSGGLDDVGKFTGLALDVVSGLYNVSAFAVFGLNLNQKPVSRRLLELMDQEGYPSWFSSADRKLLSELQKGVVVPNVVVAKDGSGQYVTVLDAVNSYPMNYQGRYVIYVKAGVYNESITIDKDKKNILLYGDGPNNTIITGSKNVNAGLTTRRTATFSTSADDFIAKSIAFENTAGPEGHQAVALLVQGDRSAIFDCTLRGYQDTMYAHTHRQFYRSCEIYGTVDFIFGYSTTLIQDCKIFVRKPGPNQQNIVVADGTKQKNMPTGVVLQNCQIMPEASLYPDRLTVKSYLARPWKAFSRAVFMENVIGDLIQPEGFIPWSPIVPNTQNCYFAEYANTGLGANTQSRPKWGKGLISVEEAVRFTAEQWLQAGTWLPATGIPFDSGFTKS